MFASCALSRLRFAGGTPPDERRMSRELFLPLSGETERQEGGGGGSYWTASRGTFGGYRGTALL